MKYKPERQPAIVNDSLIPRECGIRSSFRRLLLLHHVLLRYFYVANPQGDQTKSDLNH